MAVTTQVSSRAVADHFQRQALRFSGSSSNGGAFQNFGLYRQMLEHVFGDLDWEQLKDGTTRKEKADAISAYLWKRLQWSGLLSRPEASATAIQDLEDSIRRDGRPGVMRDATLTLMQFLRENLDKPDQLETGLHLMVEVLLSGGYKKLKKILDLIATGRFASASPEKQGQLLVESLGPVWIKALQTLSTVPGFFPPHIQQSLEPLYEKGTPLPFDAIRKVIESELQILLEVAYPWFNPVPIKTGSIAQIHEAILPTGDHVAVKIVKGDVIETLDEDLEMLQPFATLMQHLAPQFDASTFLGKFFELLRKECDMVFEGRKLKEAATTFHQDAKIQVPKVYDSHTTSRVLTMEFLETESLLNFKGKKAIAGLYLAKLMDQIFTHGLCQADPHPGNLPYDERRKKFGFLDAGLAYKIPAPERTTFAKMLVALTARDSKLFREALLPPSKPGTDENLASQALSGFLKTEMAKIDLLKPENVLAFLAHTELKIKTLELRADTVNPLLWKTLLTGLGVSKTLYPELNHSLIIGRKLALHLLKTDRNFLWNASKILIEQRYQALQQYLSNLFRQKPKQK